jgi:hypothetical protein
MKCEARVDDPPHYLRTYPCRNNAKHVRYGLKLCGVHNKMVDRHGQSIIKSWIIEKDRA